MIAKILVDAYQHQLVDLAAILRAALIAATAPEAARVVIVMYAGSDHTSSVVSFWRTQGFSHAGLPRKGLVGNDDWELDKPQGLKLPPYLHDFSLLFPIT